MKQKNFFPSTIPQLIIFILFSIALGGIGFFILDNFIKEITALSLNVLAIFLLLIPSILVILHNKKKNTPISLFNKKNIKVGYIYVFISPIVLILINYTLLINLNYTSNKDITFSALSVSVIAPIFEELYFRGIILNGLMQRYKKYHYIIAFIISNCLFTFVHSPEQYIFVFLAGTYLSFSFISTRNILFPIAIHIIFNSINYFY